MLEPDYGVRVLHVEEAAARYPARLGVLMANGHHLSLQNGQCLSSSGQVSHCGSEIRAWMYVCFYLSACFPVAFSVLFWANYSNNMATCLGNIAKNSNRRQVPCVLWNLREGRGLWPHLGENICGGTAPPKDQPSEDRMSPSRSEDKGTGNGSTVPGSSSSRALPRLG